MPEPTSDALPRIGVATVAYRSNHVLPTFLQSLADATGEPFALAVADNRPGDESAAATVTAEYEGIYLALAENPGYGGAINRAVAALPQTVKWVVISNPDVVFHNGSIAALIATAEVDDRIGAVGPVVQNIDGTVYPSARAIPSVRTGIGHALFANVWKSNPWTAAYRDGALLSGDRRDVGWLSGSCLVVRRSAFAQIEGFDEGYFMYFEDVDLGYRLGRAGWRSVYEPTAVATHTGAHSTGTESATMVRAHHDSARRFLRSKYRGPLLWPLRAAFGMGLSVRAAIMTRTLHDR